MAAHLEALGMGDEERVADGGIAVALRACGEVIDLAQTVRKMPLEPEAPRVVVEVGYPGLQLPPAEQDAVVEAAREERRSGLSTEVLRTERRAERRAERREGGTPKKGRAS